MGIAPAAHRRRSASRFAAWGSRNSERSRAGARPISATRTNARPFSQARPKTGVRLVPRLDRQRAKNPSTATATAHDAREKRELDVRNGAHDAQGSE